MHLDTMLTMADYGVFTKYAGMGTLSSYTVEPGATASELKVTGHPPEDMHRVIAAALDLPEITVLTAVQDVHSASREQWDDGGQRARGRAGRGRGLRAECHHKYLPARPWHRSDHRPR
jgi:arginine deiminase